LVLGTEAVIVGSGKWLELVNQHESLRRDKNATNIVVAVIHPEKDEIEYPIPIQVGYIRYARDLIRTGEDRVSYAACAANAYSGLSGVRSALGTRYRRRIDPAVAIQIDDDRVATIGDDFATRPRVRFARIGRSSTDKECREGSDAGHHFHRYGPGPMESRRS
jgi:hypothetical protein